MDRLSELVAAVAAAPDEDAPRLVCADWLLERGDPLGELIALQVALARAEAADEEMADEVSAIERERRLRVEGDARWLGVLRAVVPGGYVMRRGFVEHVTVWGRALAEEEGDELATKAPLLRSVEIEISDVARAAFGAMRDQLRAVRLVEGEPLEAERLHAFVARELPRVRRLEMVNVPRDRETAQAVVELPVELEALTFAPRRVIADRPTSEDELPWVLRALAARQRALKELALGRCYGLVLEGLDELRGLQRLALHDCNVGEQLDAMEASGLVALEIDGDELAPDALERLLRTLPGLRRLRLRRAELGDEHAEAIAASAPAELRRLDVSDNRLSEAGAHALLDGLPGLVRLEVGGNSSVGAAMLEQVRARERVRYRPALPGYPRELQDQIDLRRKIPAIKEYRAFTTDLANALHAVERIMDERS